MTEDKMVEWNHRAQTPGDSEGQGSLACCSPWSHKVSDTTEWLNNNHPVGPAYSQNWDVSKSYLAVCFLKWKCAPTF